MARKLEHVGQSSAINRAKGLVFFFFFTTPRTFDVLGLGLRVLENPLPNKLQDLHFPNSGAANTFVDHNFLIGSYVLHPSLLAPLARKAY